MHVEGEGPVIPGSSAPERTTHEKGQQLATSKFPSLLPYTNPACTFPGQSLAFCFQSLKNI